MLDLNILWNNYSSIDFFFNSDCSFLKNNLMACPKQVRDWENEMTKASFKCVFWRGGILFSVLQRLGSEQHIKRAHPLAGFDQILYSIWLASWLYVGMSHQLLFCTCMVVLAVLTKFWAFGDLCISKALSPSSSFLVLAVLVCYHALHAF